MNAECRIQFKCEKIPQNAEGLAGMGSSREVGRLTKRCFTIMSSQRKLSIYIAGDFNLDLMKRGRVSGGFKPGIHESRKHNQLVGRGQLKSTTWTNHPAYTLRLETTNSA